jgi:hypothetical protein
MRPRWHDWVIVLGIVAIAATGVVAIWGDDLRRLWRGEGKGEQAAEPVAAPPPGPAAGPF